MAVLVAGPSSVGKSTFLRSTRQRRRFGVDLPHIAYASQIGADGFPPDSFVHYNLLRGPEALGLDEAAVANACGLLDDPAFMQIVGSGLIESAFVLAAPENELMSRMAGRTVVEVDVNGRYPGDYWRRVALGTDLPALYGSLFDLLDGVGIPFRVLLSSADLSTGFEEIARADIGDALAGRLGALSSDYVQA